MSTQTTSAGLQPPVAVTAALPPLSGRESPEALAARLVTADRGSYERGEPPVIIKLGGVVLGASTAEAARQHLDQIRAVVSELVHDDRRRQEAHRES